LEGKWGVWAHQIQEMKGIQGSGDPERREAKSGLPSSGHRLDTSCEKDFFADERWSVREYYMSMYTGGTRRGSAESSRVRATALVVLRRT